MKIIEKLVLALFICASALWMGIAISTLWLMTLGIDEAWVLNGIRSVLSPYQHHLSSEMVTTNGGFFALGNLILEHLFGSRVWVHRLFSFVCFLAMLLILILSQKQSGSPSRSIVPSLLLIAPILAINGTAEISSMALGASVAVFLLVLACVLWCRHGTPRTSLALFCGCLLGLAAASRPELILAIPAFYLFGVLQRRELGWRCLWPPRHELVFGAITVALFSVSLVSVVYFGSYAHWVGSTGGSSLLRFLDYPRQLNKILIGQSFIPFGILIMLTLLPFWNSQTLHKPQIAPQRLTILLLITAWLLFFAWFIQAPIPHLRYLWPALVCFCIPAGILLKNYYETATLQNNLLQKIMCLLLATGIVGSAGIGSFRSIVMGEQDYLSWEWSREMRADYFRRFQHIQDQSATVRFLRQLPEDAVITCYIQPFPLRYLTERPVMLLNEYLKEQQKYAGPLFLVLSPGIGVFAHLPADAYVWLERHSRLSAQFGNYSIYELPADLLRSAPNQLQMKSRPYTGHPVSAPWFGH